MKISTTFGLVLALTILFSGAFAQESRRPELYVQTGIDNFVDAIAFSPDGRLLATGDKNDLIKLWETTNGREIRTFAAHKTPVRSLVFSPDGKTLASGAEDGEIILWKIENGERIANFKGHTKDVTALEFTPDGKNIISGSWDKSIKIWNAADGKLLKTTKTGDLVETLALSSDGNLIAAADGSLIRIIEVKTGREIRKLSGHAAEFNGISASVKALAFSTDATVLASGGDDRTIKIWDASSGKELKTLTGHTEDVLKLYFTRTSETLLSSSYDGTFRRWNTANWESEILLSETEDLQNAPTEFAVSPDEKTFARPFERSIGLYDLRSGQKFAALGEKSRIVTDALFSADGKLLASGGGDQLVRLWNAVTGEMKTLGRHDGWISKLAFSPDNKLLASTAVSQIKIWDAATGRQLREFVFFDSIRVVQFSPDGKQIAAYEPVCAGDNPCFAVWDIESGREIKIAALPDWFETAERKFCQTDVNLDETIVEAVCTGENEFDRQVKIDLRTDEKSVLATLYVFGENDWLVVTPDGLFDGTPNAFKQLIWRFADETFNYAPLEAFFKEFYYPGLLPETMRGKMPKPPERSLAEIDIRQPAARITAVNGQKPISRIFTETATVSEPLERREAEISVEVVENNAPVKSPKTASASGARDLRLFRNGSLVKHWKGDVFAQNSICALIAVKANEPRRAVCKTTAAITAGENEFSTYVFNRENVKSNDHAVAVSGAGKLKKTGTLYVLAIGVNKYAASAHDLKFAVADIDAIGRELTKAQTDLGQYAETKVIKLADRNATKQNILQALKSFASRETAETPGDLPNDLPNDLRTEFSKIKSAQPEDALIVHFSGHGTARCKTDARTKQTDCDRFYLIPHDGFPTEKSADAGAQSEKLYAQSVSDEELENALETVDAGKLLMVIDACNSGQALEAAEKRRGPMNSRGLAQLAYEKGMYILTASQSSQAALEISKLGHGLLTFSLLEGLKKADRDGDEQVLEREWFDHAVREVPLMQLEAIKTRAAENRGLPAAEQRSELVYVEGEDANLPPEKRGLQSPRLFYRRESEANPLIVSKPK